MKKKTLLKKEKKTKPNIEKQESQTSKKGGNISSKISNYFTKLTRSIIFNKKKPQIQTKLSNYSTSKSKRKESFDTETATKENNEVFDDENEDSHLSVESQGSDKSSEYEGFDQNLFRREVIFRFSIAEMLRGNLEFLGLDFDVCIDFMGVFDQKKLKRICLSLYEDAMKAGEKAFPSMSPHRIQIELSYCIFLYEIIGHKEKARRRLKDLFMNSLKDMNR